MINKNCIICNKEFIGTIRRKLCGDQKCKKQNARNISKKIQKNWTLEKRNMLSCAVIGERKIIGKIKENTVKVQA